MPAFQHTLLRLSASTVYNATSNGTADHAGDYHATTTTLFPYLLSALGFVGFMLFRQMFMQPLMQCLMQCLMKPIRGCMSKLGRVCSRGAPLLAARSAAAGGVERRCLRREAPLLAARSAAACGAKRRCLRRGR